MFRHIRAFISEFNRIQTEVPNIYIGQDDLVAERSKARIYCRLLAGIAGSNPAGGHGCLSRECCVLSGRGLCDRPIPYPEASYRLLCVIACDLRTSRMRRPWPALGCCTRENKIYNFMKVVYILNIISAKYINMANTRSLFQIKDCQ